MSKIIIKNGQYLELQNESLSVKAGDILIENDRIVDIAQEINDKEARIIDADRCLVMPGLVNTHTHAAMTLLRSYADDMELKPWLEEKIWPAEANLNGEHVYWGSKLAFLEMIKSGTTTFSDMYFVLEGVAVAAVVLGFRGVRSRGLIEFTDPECKSIRENIELIRKYHRKGDGRITCLFGPHAPYTCTPGYMAKIMEAAEKEGVGLHIHIAETKQEADDIRKLYGKSPVAHLRDLGVFEHHVVAAHCVHVSEEDLQILKEKNVGVCHNPTSNLKLASGVAPVPKMLEMGINVGIGTDGTSSNNNLNMFEEMHITSLIHKGYQLDPLVVSAEDVLKMATIGGARVLGLEKEIGSVEIGKKADLILVDLEKPHLYPKADLIANMVYSAQGSDVKTVLIDGKIVLENYSLMSYDEREIMEKAEEMKKDLLK